MASRPAALERALAVLRYLPVGDPAAKPHVLTVRSAAREDPAPVLRALAVLDLDWKTVDRAVERLRTAVDAGRQGAAARLREALVPARDHALRHLASGGDGLAFIVELREALLDLLARDAAAADLAWLDDDLRAFLAARFDLARLELRRLTWSDPAALLERVGRAEAVHAVRGWSDLKDRLDEDRRCYVFFHPALPDVPLAFTEVALTAELTGGIKAILNPGAARVDPALARCAIFYSISNCERALAGIPFGNALIKCAVELLRADLPRLRTFATLSPLPGFRAWLQEQGAAIPEEVRTALAVPGWHRDETRVAVVREPLLRLAARYVTAAKRGDGAPADPVTRFHVANGAVVERMCWLGDPTERGIRQSYGMMVNYRYALERVAENQLAYAREKHVEASPAVAALADDAPLADGGRPQRRSVAAAAAFVRRWLPQRTRVVNGPA